jgi:hypothetical protein
MKRIASPSSVPTLLLIGDTTVAAKLPPSGAAELSGLSEISLRLFGRDLDVRGPRVSGGGRYVER